MRRRESDLSIYKPLYTKGGRELSFVSLAHALLHITHTNRCLERSLQFGVGAPLDLKRLLFAIFALKASNVTAATECVRDFELVERLQLACDRLD